MSPEELMRLADDGNPHHDEPHDDCLSCGMCESCIERSIATAEEMADPYEVERAWANNPTPIELEPPFVPAWDGDYEE